MNLDVHRRARLAAADAVSAAIVADAEAEATRELTDAREAVAAELHRARADGAADADREMADERATSRRRAHSTVLATQAEAYLALEAAVMAALPSLRSDPRYGALLDRLEAMARDQLGPDAHIDRDLPTVGGVVAAVGNRRVDYSLAALAGRCLRRLGGSAGRLWQ